MTTKGGESTREKRLGKDRWMRRNDRQEERDKSRSQLMLSQLLHKIKKKPAKTDEASE